MFKFVNYKARTSAKRTVGILLNTFLLLTTFTSMSTNHVEEFTIRIHSKYYIWVVSKRGTVTEYKIHFTLYQKQATKNCAFLLSKIHPVSFECILVHTLPKCRILTQLALSLLCTLKKFSYKITELENCFFTFRCKIFGKSIDVT